MIVTQDNSVFIERAINNVQEHALIGGILVVLIIFAFLRDFRSTLIVCTSIPVSVIGTFALLYFGGFTLNTMTFGGLALGIGMIVDAAIVVLENTHRHLHMGKDRMTAAIDGSEEVWSAILASTLTHIAVFVPLLFLSGTASIMFTQLSVVVMFSLAMSLFVAVTIVPVLCSRWLKTPDEEAHGDRHHGALLPRQRALPRARWTSGYRKAIHVALNHRPTVIGGAAALVVAAVLIYPHDRRRADAADRRGRGQRQRRARRRHARRAHRGSAAAARGDGQGARARGRDHHHPGRRRRQQLRWQRRRRRQHHRGQIRVMLVPRDQRDAHQRGDRDRAAPPAGRACPASSSAPTRPAATTRSCGSSAAAAEQQRRLEPSAARNPRPRPRRRPPRRAGRARDDGGHAGHRRRQHRTRRRPARDRRPRRSPQGRDARHDGRQRGQHDPDQRRRHHAAQFRERGNEYPIVVRLREADREEISDVGDVLLSTPTGQVVPAKNVLAVNREAGPVQIERKNMERITRVNAEIEIPLSEAVEGRPGASRPGARAAGLLRRLRRRGRGAGAVVPAAAAGADPRRAARLRGDGVAVRVAARSVHHHVLDSGRRRSAWS